METAKSTWGYEGHRFWIKQVSELHTTRPSKGRWETKPCLTAPKNRWLPVWRPSQTQDGGPRRTLPPPTVIPTDGAALINFLPFVCQGNKEPFKKSLASPSSASETESLSCARAHLRGSWNPLINDSWDSHSYTCTQQHKRLIGILFPLSKGGQTLVIKLQFLHSIK